MPTRSQRPIVDRLLSVDPLKLHGLAYGSVDSVLAALDEEVGPMELIEALKDHGIAVSVETVYRWKRDNQ